MSVKIRANQESFPVFINNTCRESTDIHRSLLMGAFS